MSSWVNTRRHISIWHVGGGQADPSLCWELPAEEPRGYHICAQRFPVWDTRLPPPFFLCSSSLFFSCPSISARAPWGPRGTKVQRAADSHSWQTWTPWRLLSPVCSVLSSAARCPLMHSFPLGSGVALSLTSFYFFRWLLVNKVKPKPNRMQPYKLQNQPKINDNETFHGAFNLDVLRPAPTKKKGE